ncbi:MAG TPA: MEDS domain-containing protein [Gaiellaceae bacterium]
MSSWRNFIERAPAAGHAVQVYDDVPELAGSVAGFLTAGFGAGESGLVIARPEHWQALTAELEQRGSNASGLERKGLLAHADAEELLGKVMEGELPSAARFERVVGGIVDAVSARGSGRTIRAFGEMVDVLWRRGEHRAALALEELWNDLAQTRSFALLCGYGLDIFELAVQREALPEVIRLHSHARIADEPWRLAAAVDQALSEVVGPARAARVYLNVAEQVPPGSQPRAQAVLSWLSCSGRPYAHEVLQRARMHYARLRGAPAAA